MNHVIVNQALKHPSITHGFFGRNGGVSNGIYKSLNVGVGSEDEEQNVRENREKIKGVIGCRELVTAYQTHSSTAIFVTKETQERPMADAIVTNEPKVAVAVLTADCAPILIADKKNKVVAACHAGWKGALKGIVEQTISLMIKHGAKKGHIQAVVGPTISKNAYEVGPEFVKEFVGCDQKNKKFFEQKNGKTTFGLAAFVRHKLEKQNVGEVRVVNRCTYTEQDKFFSYRRATHNNQTDYGRQMSVIMIQ